MKRLVALLCLFCLATTASAAWDINQLMNDLAQKTSGRAKFVEKQYLAVLDKPLISSGELSYSAPNRLEKRTLQPKQELITLDNDMLYVERGGKKYSLRLSSRPEAVAFVDSIRGTLNGNRKLLEASYALMLTGNQANWTLRLLPSDTDIAALLSRIDIHGVRDRVTSVEYQLADGDRTVLSITPIEAGQ
jgi:hypothetical protein